MEEEEARLKALLEQTSDFDERKKIRAELRVVRKKMLDSLNSAAASESSERAARRAERAKARKVEEANHTGPVINDKILAEIDDEETLQKLLDEMPTSQFDERRMIRARLREVKRKKTEGDEPAPRRGRRALESSNGPLTKEPETFSNNFEKATSVTINTTPEDGPNVTMKTKVEESSVVISETPSSGPSVDEPSTVTIETTATSVNANHLDNGDVSFKLTVRQSNVQIVQNGECEEVSNKVDIDGSVEAPIEEPLDAPLNARKEPHIDDNQNEEPVDNELDRLQNGEAVVDDMDKEIPVEVDKKKDENEHVTEDVDQEVPAAVAKENDVPAPEPSQAGNEISVEVEVKINNGAEDSAAAEEETQNKLKIDKDVEDETKTPDLPDGGKTSRDNTRDLKPKSKAASRWPPQDDEKKKAGRTNTTDFRSNLKKSGKIGENKVVNLEKKTSTSGAQIDFRSGNLKKSGRLGSGPVNLENKISTSGAQVDFRSSSLKPSGKIGSGTVNLERKTTTTGAQVDFRGALKKGGGANGSVTLPAPSVEHDAAGSLKSEIPAQKPEEPQPAAKDVKEPKKENQTAAEGEKVNPPVLQDDISVAKEEAVAAPKEQEVSIGKKSMPAPPKEVAAEKKEATEKTEATEKKEATEKTEATEMKEQNVTKPNEIKNEEKAEQEKKPEAVDKKVDVKVDNKAATPPSASKKEWGVGGTKLKNEFKFKPREKVEDSKTAGKSKLFERMSKFQAKESATPPYKPKATLLANRSQKKEPATDTAVNGVAVKLEETSLEVKESTSPVQVEVSEHVKDDGDTRTEVREVNTKKEDGDVVEEKKEVTTVTKEDGDVVEEKKEVTTVTKTSTPGGGKFTSQTKQTTTRTTGKKSFLDPELQKRMAARQRERVAAKREQASSAKNKRMAFMQKLEANSPAQTGPTQVKRSSSNVDKLLMWCRFKLQYYKGVKLANFSSSWADGLAFCALLHLYLPDKIPYDELVAAGDKRRNFECAFSVATEAGVPELLEIDDMLSVSSPEPKSVMTYVSSIYKHFNPS